MTLRERLRSIELFVGFVIVVPTLFIAAVGGAFDDASLRASRASAEPAPVQLDLDRAIRPGHRGEDVREVQQALRDFGYVLTVDGIYGPRTLRVVRHFQRVNNLPTTGIVGPLTLAAINRADAPLAPAERGQIIQLTPPPPPPEPVGLLGLPFAPPGLSDCNEFRFYRQQWNMPEWFDRIARRESNCRNEDGVRTWCCHGWLQLYVSVHLRDHRLAPHYAACGVRSHHDINSDTPVEKQRHLCAAKALYTVVGMKAWAL